MVPVAMMVMMTQKMRHTANKVTEISRFVVRHVLGNEAPAMSVYGGDMVATSADREVVFLVERGHNHFHHHIMT